MTTNHIESFYGLMLLNGPALYFISINNRNSAKLSKVKILHLVPFLLIILKDFLIYFFDSKNSFNQPLLNINDSLSGISQIIYASWISGRQQQQNKSDRSITSLIRQLCLLLIINGIFKILVQLKIVGLSIDFGFNGQLISYLTYSLSILLMARDLTHYGREKSITTDQQIPYKNSQLEPELLKTIEAKIRSHLKEHNVYLQPNITLEEFSEQIKVPKNHVSQVLNSYMGKNFYRLIAEYRIEYAIEDMRQNRNLKIEAVAYNCGFNSLSAFNRYFKEITGIQPSIYLRELQN